MLLFQMMDERSNNILLEKLAVKEKELVETKKRESECKTTLSNLRRTAAKLIRALNEVGTKGCIRELGGIMVGVFIVFQTFLWSI